MIKNSSETTAKQFELFPINNKSIELFYSGDRISSDGDLLLLQEVEIIKGISNCITDTRDQRYIDHIIEELVG